MQIGIFAKTFTGKDPQTVLAAAAAAGFDGVQYNMACSGLEAMPAAIGTGIALSVRQAASNLEQAIFAVSGTYNMAHPDEAVRRVGLERLAVLAAACKTMGTGLITLCTGTRDAEDQWRHHPDNGSREAWRDMCNSFAAAIRIAETHDILLGVEPELANVVNGADAANRLITSMQSDRIRIVLDPANLFEVETESGRRRIISEAVDLLADRIVMAHAKDRHADGRFATAGTAVIDFDHFLSALRKAGFNGPVVTHGLDATEAAGVARFLRAAMGRLG